MRKLNSRLWASAQPLFARARNYLGSFSAGCFCSPWGLLTAYDGQEKSQRVYLIMSDGEQQEGQTWEGVMFAGKYKLHNLTAIIDRNNIQIDGYTEDIMPLENLKAKYEALIGMF